MSAAPDPMAVRPATIRRQRRLHALIAEFAERDMGNADVALFLECSPTAARNYLNELAEASLISPRRGAPQEGGVRNGYRLNGDPWLVRTFLAELDASCGHKATLKRGRKPSANAQSDGPRHFHMIADDQYLGAKASQVAVRRDPLVAALFGKESPRNQESTAS